MKKQETLNKIRELGVLAVLRVPSPELTLEAVEALVDAGVFGIEITYSTPNAGGIVRYPTKRYGNDILLGMGTLSPIACDIDY